MKTLKVKIKGFSLLELREKYGTAKGGFYDQDWYLNEPFAKEKPLVGIYTIKLQPELNNLTYKEQLDKIKPHDFLHPAVLAQAMTDYPNEMMDFWSRTNVADSSGVRVGLGLHPDGLVVNNDWNGNRSSSLGVASARKFVPSKLGAINISSLSNKQLINELTRRLK